MKMFRKTNELSIFLTQNYSFLYWIFIIITIIHIVIGENQQSGDISLTSDRLTATTTTTSGQHIEQQCIEKCSDQNHTNSEHLDCGLDCFITQCTIGCKLWESALVSSCKNVCNKTSQEESTALYCVMGCSNGLTKYFNWLRDEVGTPAAPALVADTLTATSLSLECEIPPRLKQLTKDRQFLTQSYLVQWLYEEVAGDWKFCRNQSMGDNSTVKVENLQPYTKYRFRVAFLIAPNHTEFIYSEQSVIINTLPMGTPQSQPAYVRAVAVDHTRISISWEPGPFPNGPILSYVLEIKELSPHGSFTLKDDIPASENFYLFEKLKPSTEYQITTTMRNAIGEGPAAVTMVKTFPGPLTLPDDQKTTLILAAEYSVLVQGSDLLSDPAQIVYSSQFRLMGITIHIAKKLIFVSDAMKFIYKIPLETPERREVILSSVGKNNYSPLSLSMDWLNDQLYILGEQQYAQNVKGWQISRCNLDGRALAVVLGGLRQKPHHFEVDPYNGYLFWVINNDESNENGLFRLDLGDVSNGVKYEVIPFSMLRNKNLGAFALDHARFRILVPLQDQNAMLSIDLDGKREENIRNNTQSPRFRSVKSLAVANQFFYWTNGDEVLNEEYHKKEDRYFHNVYPDLSNRTFISVCVNLPSAQPIPIPFNPPRNVQALLSTTKGKVSWHVPHLLGIQGKGAWQDWFYELEITPDDSGETIIQSNDNSSGTSYSNKNINKENDDSDNLEHMVDVTNLDTQSFLLRNIKSTHYPIDHLQSDTNYKFRVAAYSKDGGKGPWSTEFRSKTLKSTHDRYLIWSSNDGLLQSDILGEHMHALIPRNELGMENITDIAWYEDLIYFVCNSTLRYYNRTNGKIGHLENFHSIQSIAIDWIGKRLYWFNPLHQTINRGNLNGYEQEPLVSVALGGQETFIKIDSINGYMYVSTVLSVEYWRLNGKDKYEYYRLTSYSGKNVMGLTLDHDSHRVYWIVRSYDGTTLFSAKMAPIEYHNHLDGGGGGSGGGHSAADIREYDLNENILKGHLTYFSDRLIWLLDDHTVVISNMTGKNLAHIKNSKLNGLRAFSVIDPTHHLLPNQLKQINVIPEQINSSTVRISGNWNQFNITWEPIQNVNYGQIFYELKYMDNTTITSDTYNYHFNEKIPPYTLMEISIRAFTYWASSKLVRVPLRTPTGVPSAPRNPRVFLEHNYDPLGGGLNIMATFRWSEPERTNGPLQGYRIKICRNNDVKCENETIGNILEMNFVNLSSNSMYSFQVQAFSMIDHGPNTKPVMINTNHIKPIPILLAATNDDDIIKIDFDLQTKDYWTNGHPITQMVHIREEGRLFWINENNELISYKQNKLKLWTIQTIVLSMNIDWFDRVIYWSQIDASDAYNFGTSSTSHVGNRPSMLTQQSTSIYALDLNKYNGGEKLPPVQLLTRTKYIYSILISPLDRTLYWIETDRYTDEIGQLIEYNLDRREIEIFFTSSISCLTMFPSPITSPSSIEQKSASSETTINPQSNQIYRNISMDTSGDRNESKIIWIDVNHNIFSLKIKQKICQALELTYNDTMNSIHRDNERLYWTETDRINMFDESKRLQSIDLPNVTQILVFHEQIYPNEKCLRPAMLDTNTDDYPDEDDDSADRSNRYHQHHNNHNVYMIPILEKRLERSLILRLPQPKLHRNCHLRPPGLKYTIMYQEWNVDETNHQHQLQSSQFEKCNPIQCNTIISYDEIKEIPNLKPFTKYTFQIGVNSYYGERLQKNTIYGPIVIFVTAIGAPGKPQNLLGETISPTEISIQWWPPNELNSDVIWYEIHWTTQNAINGVKNRQQQVVPETYVENDLHPISMPITKLLPNQLYNVWVRAYSSNQTFNESDKIDVKTLPEPDNITCINVTPYSLKLHWNVQENVTRFILQYQILNDPTINDQFIVMDSNNISLDQFRDDEIINESEYFTIENLQPKTQYRFTIQLYYSANHKQSYQWPQDNRFVFTTLGDKPSAPGKPIIRHVIADVYQVSWDPAKDNGGSIDEYSLEALQTRISNRLVKRATNTINQLKEPQLDDDRQYRSVSADQSVINDNNKTRSISMDGQKLNYTTLISSIPLTVEVADVPPLEETWTVHYNGTDTYWIIKDLQPITQYAFRVRAHNTYGWGLYSTTSEPISEPYVSEKDRNYLLIAIILPVVIVTFLVLAVCIIILFHKKQSEKKKAFHENNNRLPDVELANLRELPRSGNFIHNNNILYSTGPLTDADIALLPQIRRDQITMANFLGSGAFGEVYEGFVKYFIDDETTTVGEIRVAIKTLRKGASEQEKSEFLKEAQLMSNFKHEHILRLIGVCFDFDALYIIMELMQGGDLLSFLRQSRPVAGTPSSLTLLDLISMCVDIASGCRYLEEMHFVHRDLACRNCLVSSVDPVNRVVKIGDFGLARDIYKNDYYRKDGEGLLPVRWMSPESLVDGVFTSQSDIWAFGVICWEILTLGQQPYPARNNVEVLNYVRDGGRLGRPGNCPQQLYELMLKCWSYRPEERPTFRYCLDELWSLQENTFERIEITTENLNRPKNGGVFNRLYLEGDNGNDQLGTLKIITNGHEQIEPPIIITPTSSRASPINQEYLDLINDENDIQIYNGYEKPLPDNTNNNTSNAEEIVQNQELGLSLGIVENKERTFSSSSTVSELSVCPIISQLTSNTILKVTLPNSKEDCSSNEKLLTNEIQQSTPQLHHLHHDHHHHHHHHHQQHQSQHHLSHNEEQPHSLDINKKIRPIYTNTNIEMVLDSVDGKTMM